MVYKLYPEIKDYVWGGTRLVTDFNKRTDKRPAAESWELSFHPDGPSRLSDGRLLSDVLSAKDFGKNAEKFPFFPLLIKLIDAKSDLSVQVHPSDKYALSHENSYGKTEMWYVVAAEDGAGVYVGFKRPVTADGFAAACSDGTILSLLNFYQASPGDCFFIPSGTVHAIGAGCLICEIQQNSNLTYRVYDHGRGRELHTEKALAVTDLSAYAPLRFRDGVLGECEYFTASRLDVRGSQTVAVREDSFLAVTCVEGGGSINGDPVLRGDSFFVTAGTGNVTLSGDMTLILTRIP